MKSLQTRGLGLTHQLANYTSTIIWRNLPAEVQHEATRAFVNWISVVIGGCREQAVTLAARTVPIVTGRNSASVIGHGIHTDPANAAFVNCIASSVLAYDDAHLPTIAHPSGPAAAALFAIAQTRSISGETFLNALALGIEIQCRVASMLVSQPSPLHPSLYVNGFSGPIGVAAAAARLLELDDRRTTWAMGIAASQASGFRSVHGTMSAHFRPGHASRCGLTAAILAEEGFDCTEDALEASGGFIDVYAPGSDPSLALEGLGIRHAMLENRYKPYPCGIVIHPVIDACQDLRRQLPVGSDIAEVRLFVNPVVLRLTGKRNPTTDLESHVSVFHWAAVALLHDRPGLAATQPPLLTDPSVAALRREILAESDQQLGTGSARAKVRLASGDEFEATVLSAKGSRDRPLTDEELNAKFSDLVSDKLSAEATRVLLKRCWHIAKEEDVGAALRDLLP